jgi:hypothetical protein
MHPIFSLPLPIRVCTFVREHLALAAADIPHTSLRFANPAGIQMWGTNITV